MYVCTYTWWTSSYFAVKPEPYVGTWYHQLQLYIKIETFRLGYENGFYLLKNDHEDFVV